MTEPKRVINRQMSVPLADAEVAAQSTLDAFSLKGRVALLTGGRAMYGRGCTEGLADAGATVYIASHSSRPDDPVVDEIKARGGGGDVHLIELHQEDEESIRNMVETIIEAEGRIDVFVNASRVMPRGGRAWFQSEEGLDWAIRVNAAGSFYMSALVGDQMIRQRSGSIINFGSMMGLVGVEYHNYDRAPGMKLGASAHDYALNKSGIVSWTRHAAAYYGRYGIRVNCICPGGLATTDMNPRFVTNYNRHTMLGSLALGTDIRGLALFLASDASSHITGLTIPFDGGYTNI